MKYRPKLKSELTKLMAAGFSDTQVIAQWKISKDTFYRWLRQYEDFKEAHEIGKVMFDAMHERLGVAGMHKSIDIDYQFWRDLGKFRHGWAEKSAAGNTNINIDTINVLNQQTNDELKLYIKSQMEANPELLELVEYEDVTDRTE